MKNILYISVAQASIHSHVEDEDDHISMLQTKSSVENKKMELKAEQNESNGVYNLLDNWYSFLEQSHEARLPAALNHSHNSTNLNLVEQVPRQQQIARATARQQAVQALATPQEVKSIEAHRTNWFIPTVSFLVPLMLGTLAAFGISLEMLEKPLTPTAKRVQPQLKAVIYSLLIVLGWTAHGELLQLEPRILNSHSVLVSILDSSSFVMLLPLGLWLRGKEELIRILYGTILLSCVEFVMSFFWDVGLAHLSMSTFSLMAQLSPVFVCMLSMIVLRERTSILKGCIVLSGLCGFGIIFISHHLIFLQKEKMYLGYVSCGIAMLLYSLFNICYVYFGISTVPANGKIKDHMAHLALYLGLRGAVSAVIPPYLTATAANLMHENVVFGDGFPNMSETSVLLGSMLCNWIYVFAGTLALVKFSPLWVAMSTSLAVPIAAFFDAQFDRSMGSLAMGSGAVILVFSFIGLNLIEEYSVHKILMYSETEKTEKTILEKSVKSATGVSLERSRSGRIYNEGDVLDFQNGKLSPSGRRVQTIEDYGNQGKEIWVMPDGQDAAHIHSLGDPRMGEGEIWQEDHEHTNLIEGNAGILIEQNPSPPRRRVGEPSQEVSRWTLHQGIISSDSSMNESTPIDGMVSSEYTESSNEVNTRRPEHLAR